MSFENLHCSICTLPTRWTNYWIQVIPVLCLFSLVTSVTLELLLSYLFYAFLAYNLIWHFWGFFFFLLPWKLVHLINVIFPSSSLTLFWFVIKCLLVCTALLERSWRKMPAWSGKLFWETLLVKSLQSDDFFFLNFSLWKQAKETSLDWIPVEIHILFFWIGTISNIYLKLRLEQFPFPRKEVESHIPHRWEF